MSFILKLLSKSLKIHILTIEIGESIDNEIGSTTQQPKILKNLDY